MNIEMVAGDDETTSSVARAVRLMNTRNPGHVYFVSHEHAIPCHGISEASHIDLKAP